MLLITIFQPYVRTSIVITALAVIVLQLGGMLISTKKATVVYLPVKVQTLYFRVQQYSIIGKRDLK